MACHAWYTASMRYENNVHAGPLAKALKTVEQKYARERNIRAVFVVGSVARGTATGLSDIDLIHIVRRPRRYIRYFVGKTHIEVTSLTLRELPDRLRSQPVSYFSFREMLPLYDPEGLYRPVMRRLKVWRSRYHVDAKTQGDLYIILDHIQRKIISAQKSRNNARALFFSSVGLEQTLAGFFAFNDLLIPPAGEMMALLPTIKKSRFTFIKASRQ